MYIYTSEKVMPYVYICIHKETKKFYIGSRANKNQTLPSHLDILDYKTSSKIVKPNFNEYWCFILAEFFNRKEAYLYEQELIAEHWEDPLLLNGYHCHSSTGVFSHIGRAHSEETKAKMRNARIGAPGPNKGKPRSQEVKNKIKDTKRKQSCAHSEETKAKMRLAKLGKKRIPRTEQHKANLRLAWEKKKAQLK